jgi:hypothetical protein
MDAETVEINNDAEMPKELAEAWAKALVELHAKIVKQAEEHYSKMEKVEACESKSDAHPC